MTRINKVVQNIFIFLLVVTSSISYSQVYTLNSQVDSQFIKEWLILGPFSPNDLNRDFLFREGGEQNINPKEGDLITTSSGDNLFWKKYLSPQKNVNINTVIGECQDAIVYAFCQLNSDSNRTIQLNLGSDDGVAVWMNGIQIHRKDGARQLLFDQDIIVTEIKKGLNNCLIKVSQEQGEWGFALSTSTKIITTPINPKYYISEKLLVNESIMPSNLWKYHPGDDTLWACRKFDDSSWEYVDVAQTPWGNENMLLKEVGWYRFHLVIDSALYFNPLGLSIWQAGYSELYLDGKFINKLGSEIETWNGVPQIITFDDSDSHVIALRFTSTNLKDLIDLGFNSGFYLSLGNARQMTESRLKKEKMLIGFQTFFISFSGAIAILHLILFIFYPRLNQNLYFSLFLLLYAVVIYYDYQQLLIVEIGQNLAFLRIFKILWPIFLLFKLRFLYSIFYKKLPRQFWLVVFIVVYTIAMILYWPPERFDFVDLVFIITVLEIIRVIVVAIVEKKQGAWSIGVAYILFLFFISFDALMNIGIEIPFQSMLNPYAFGIISFVIAMSIYLSRDFAKTNQVVAEQKINQKILEVENERQSIELEEARLQQLSMLPKKLPLHKDLDIAFFMKTATEVGGDYYDFKQSENGTLTIIIGDATGHGMKAGTIVSATKSLFNALANELEPVHFIKKCSLAIKEMKLNKMFMAVTVAKIKDNKIRISSAGMPFPLLFRSSNSTVEEIELKGMPLGSHPNFPYQEKSIELNSGDTILFLSDGYEEMFNPSGELLGKEKVKHIFREVGFETPQGIIDRLQHEGEVWANGRNQDDDVTFMVIKVK